MIRFRLFLNYIYIVASMFALGTSGCTRRIPVATVVLVDPSGSVTPRARHDEFAAVAALIPKMQRGDSLTIIPITDNAAADIQGRVLRLRTPNRREAYDADLRRFRVEADRRYSVFSDALLAHPGQQTDILGALDVACQELDSLPGTGRRTLIVLSDFLEDDGVFRFNSNRNLANPADARMLGERLATEHHLILRNAKVYLGSLESNDFADRDSARAKAVRTFWTVLFERSGNQSEVHLDGTGMMDRLP